MNLDMALGVRDDGQVTVVGTEAINELRFEPNVNGIFVQVVMGSFEGANPGSASVVDLNPHLDYSSPTIPQEQRDLSIGDPRGIVWDGLTGYVTGMGSNNVIEIDAAGNRLSEIEVGEGPTGIALGAGVLYVMNKFEGSISTIEGGVETSRVAFHDPTPLTIKAGRPHLYDTHETSGLGQASCASCHVDGRLDGLAWDLGAPNGDLKVFNQVCSGLGFPGECEDWHPMKGPMTTQTLIGSIQTGPLHWRADREGLFAFNPAYEGLMGDDEQLTDDEMDDFTDFLSMTTPPPNPYRNMDNSLSFDLDGASAFFGRIIFTEFTGLVPGDPSLKCSGCHDGTAGTNQEVLAGSFLLDTQSLKVPQLRNMYEKTGLDHDSFDNTRGFAFSHDGAVDTLESFFEQEFFSFPKGDEGESQRRDVAAFMLSFSTDTHAGVGTQVTVASQQDVADNQGMIDDMAFLVETFSAGLVAKATIDGEARGYVYENGGTMASDRAGESRALADLLLEAAPGSEITLTVVPMGSETRIGIDRDRDTFLDRDELDVCADPADPAIFPGSPGSVDVNGDLSVNILDFVSLQAAFINGEPNGDFNQDGLFNILDFVDYQTAFVACAS